MEESKKEESKKNLRFDIDPSVLFQLGESLISDEFQAILELVKNSYDACASQVKIIIDMKNEEEINGLKYSGTDGKIIIEDNGIGMDRDTIIDGWLVISNRWKKEIKEGRQKSQCDHRTPLGDKGLGRLSVQRLGNNIDLFTKQENGEGLHFAFSWNDYRGVNKLGDISFPLEDYKFPKKKGTILVISNLLKPDIWRGLEASKRLRNGLSKLISPYSKFSDFKIDVKFNGDKIDLVQIAEEVREVATLQYKLYFDGKKLFLKGFASLDYIKPQLENDKKDFTLYVEVDKGENFFQFLSTKKSAAQYNLKRSNEKKWFVEYEKEIELNDIDKVEVFLSDDKKFIPYNPGKFDGEIDYFEYDEIKINSKNSVFNKQSDLKEFIQGMGGIKVYRDGFGVRVGDDFLNLGHGTTSRTFYALRPKNTTGYIELSAKHNIEIEEKTDREGFRDSPTYRNFYKLLQEFVTFSSDAQAFLKRTWIQYQNQMHVDTTGIKNVLDLENISGTLKKGLSQSRAYEEPLKKLSARLAEKSERAKEVIEKVKGTKEVTSDLKNEIEYILESIQLLINEAQDVMPEIASYLKELEEYDKFGQLVDDKVRAMRTQVEEVYEAVALGLTAEALSHEIFNIADHLSQRTNAIRKKDIQDLQTLQYIEYVDASIKSLRKQVSYMTPGLRYVREKKEKINFLDFIDGLANFYKERLAKNNIGIEIITSHEDLNLYMNKGKLTQIIDNLIINSEYWLKEELKKNNLIDATIYIELSPPFVQVWDNGRGIDGSVEQIIFEPFISTKADGGRGLGLFIIKELLDSAGCSIGLLPDRNERGNLFKFNIDFRGAMQ